MKMQVDTFSVLAISELASKFHRHITYVNFSYYQIQWFNTFTSSAEYDIAGPVVQSPELYLLEGNVLSGLIQMTFN